MFRTFTLLHTLEEIDEAVANLKAHWDNLEDRKARLCGVESRASTAEHIG